MDLQIRSLARQSSLSGTAFVAGDRVVSFLYRSEDGLIERGDVLLGEAQEYTPPGPLICRWTQRIRASEDAEAEARRQSMLTAEEMFLSLYEDPADGADDSGAAADGAVAQTRDLMKAVLALMLERKRVLRSLRGGRVLHVRSKREYTVPEVEITPENIISIEAELGAIVGG